MTFTESITTCFQKYATFDGIASRSEFWWFVLCQFLVNAVLSVVSSKLGMVASLVFLVPSIAVACRRLHDTDRSGWLQLLGLIPIIGWIVLIIFYAQEGKANRYGSGVDPVHVA